ncbi:MAG: response regulator transcription factor [Chloroflexi bacterium]|nr:response regulator transcription factor [Chloroflexota bacterium]
MEKVADNAVSILVVEDDPLITDLLRMGLGHEGFRVITARDGENALELLRRQQVSVVILDLMLPGMSGEEICKRIRAESNIPILVLTARDQVESKISLLKLGADDYLVKPFDFGELLARVQALLRRSGNSAESKILTFLDIEMRIDTREVFRHGQPIEMSTKEFDLLRFFLSNQRRVLSKESILNQVWGYDFMGDNNIVEVYVGHLRKKLGEPSPIQTIRGAGYSLRAPG